MAGEIAEIGQRRVAGVEQPQLHVLERRHVRDHLHASGREIRPSGREAIFHDPLRERLRHHRPRIGHAERGRDLRAVDVGGLRHDPVHHGRREGHFGFDPSGEIARSQGGELRHDPPRGMAIGGKIVARQNGEGGDTRIPPPRQRGDEKSDGRARRVRILQVMNDVGMALVQVAGLRRVAVALLGHRQRDDARGRVGQARDQRGGLLAGDFASRAPSR